MGPDRAADTRSSGDGIPDGDSVVEMDVGSEYAGRSISVNLTVAGAVAPGFATLFACDEEQPDTSSLNFQASQPIANGVITRVSEGGQVCVYVSQSAHVLLDVFGVFPAPDDAARCEGFPFTRDVTLGAGGRDGGVTESMNYRAGEEITVSVTSATVDTALAVYDEGGGLDSMFLIDDVIGIGTEQYGPYAAPFTGSSRITVEDIGPAGTGGPVTLTVTCA